MAKRWAELHRDVELLRRHFLPDPFDHLGRYANPNRVQAHTRAFLVLSHAEIESFLEEWARQLTKACEVVWKKDHRVVGPLPYLLSIFGAPNTVPESLLTRN